ncbi:hypothetical protein SynWH8103_02840 [Synechococcus sp. WH 8103]|nr:hypothetical protein SynA18461_02884 [Synechococcus sp. A18-46.1]CRY93518.1 hypothetical protein SynWH8103_02840 [Synechococcus sp. WH 8103]
MIATHFEIEGISALTACDLGSASDLLFVNASSRTPRFACLRSAEEEIRFG